MISLNNLVEQLHCPYCGSSFEIELKEPGGGFDIRHGIIRCSCYRYPIIDGILILKQHSGLANIRDRRVELLEAGDIEGARECAIDSTPLVPRSRTLWSRLVSFLEGKHVPLMGHLGSTKRNVDDPSLTLAHALELLRPGPYANYLFQRYANNSFLAAVAPLLLLKKLDSLTEPLPAATSADGGSKRCQTTAAGRERWVLDLACGIGHSSFLMRTLFPDLSVVSADHDFVNLYLARRYLIPDAPLVCIDAEVPLPFADDCFDSVFCLDGFHYIRSKVALLNELDRVVKPLGLWLFPHLHNALVPNLSPGIPLRAEDYMRCFSFLPCRLLTEAAVLRGFMRDQSLDLEAVPSEVELRSADVLTLIASRCGDWWRRHDRLAGPLWRDKSLLAINPIYHLNSQVHTICLNIAWPSDSLERECSSVKEYLPAQIEVDRSLWNRLKSRLTTKGDDETIHQLVRSFVLVPLPAGYGSPDERCELEAPRWFTPINNWIARLKV